MENEDSNIVGKKRDRKIKELYARKKRKVLEEKFPSLPETSKEYSKQYVPVPDSSIKYRDDLQFLTTVPFTSLSLDDQLQRSLTENGYEYLSQVQVKSLPHTLSGKDVFCMAPTGSGKTLSFVLPLLDRIIFEQFKPEHGVCGIILVPTRELAIQIHNEINRLMVGDLKKSPACLLIGGGNKIRESDALISGVNLIVGTPGRVLDHLLNTEFNFRNLKALVLDEADRMLDHGFEMDLKSILYKLPRKDSIQLMLFSATNTGKIQHLAKRYLNREFKIFVSVGGSDQDLTVVKNINQGFVIIDTDKKFMLLMTFIRKNRNSKTIIFFATCSSVHYFSRMLGQMKIKGIFQIHGELSQKKRTRVFKEFNAAKSGFLFTTNVCARGLDIQNVNWIIQYDPPNDIRDYVHRVGRTARKGLSGNAVLFITPNEKEFLKKFEVLNIKIKEFEMKTQVMDIQAHVEDIIEKNYAMYKLAFTSFKIKCYSYKSYPDKKIFNIRNLDVVGLAKQFGLKKVPYIPMEERS